jgi:hypothetical protein
MPVNVKALDDGHVAGDFTGIAGCTGTCLRGHGRSRESGCARPARESHPTASRSAMRGSEPAHGIERAGRTRPRVSIGISIPDPAADNTSGRAPGAAHSDKWPSVPPLTRAARLGACGRIGMRLADRLAFPRGRRAGRVDLLQRENARMVRDEGGRTSGHAAVSVLGRDSMQRMPLRVSGQTCKMHCCISQNGTAAELAPPRPNPARPFGR